MSIRSVTLKAQRRAKRNMLDSCVITRPSGVTTDSLTGKDTKTYTTVYSGTGPGGGGPCRVQQQSGISRPADVGQAQVFLSRYELQLPTSAAGIAGDDIVTITASPLTPDLVGRVFHVRELGHKSNESAGRFQIEEVVS